MGYIMISFTTFELLIYIVYAWFAIGVGVISIFAVKELFLMIKGTNADTSKNDIKGAKCYEM